MLDMTQCYWNNQDRIESLLLGTKQRNTGDIYIVHLIQVLSTSLLYKGVTALPSKHSFRA